MNRTKITREEAITISIELWEELAETGGDADAKAKWPGWEKYGEMQLDCALCEYDRARDNDCTACPYAKQYGRCGHGHLGKWVKAGTRRTRQKYARLGVEQLKALLED